ncbi:MAG TPA: glycosyltransferase [Pseudolabrys sp.]|nr:glycosyltransferase [Pseudolabrys sp.]
MLSVIIAARESERTLVPTLAALVPGAAAGLLGEVVIADGGSRDATAEVADLAGCRLITSNEPIGPRLKAAAATTRSPWLMFLRAGTVPQPGWLDAVDHFTAGSDPSVTRAAVFRPARVDDLTRPGLSEIVALFRAALGGRPRPEQGLLIARHFYDAVGGHPNGNEAEAALLRRLGRRRIGMLPAAARFVIT